MPRLQELLLQRNAIEAFPDCYISSLEVLDISENPIAAVPPFIERNSGKYSLNITSDERFENTENGAVQSDSGAVVAV